MKLLYLLFSFCFTPLSYAYFKTSENASDIQIGPDTSVFKIGRDIYSYGGQFNGIVSKFGIDENETLYAESYYVKDLDFACMFCFSFVMSDNSVLTITGDDYMPAANKSYNNNMGVFYFNPIDNTAPKDANYKMLEGSPTQRFFHQAVITPDKKSVYVFGGFERASPKNINLNIVQFDISSSTFITHGNLTFIGGTATMLP
jgi:hypothetical protein